MKSLNNLFWSTFVLGQDITTDKPLWKICGQLGFKTYNSTKRAWFRLKVYKLCPSTSLAAGYTSCFKVYTGQNQGNMLSSKKNGIALDRVWRFLAVGTAWL